MKSLISKLSVFAILLVAAISIGFFSSCDDEDDNSLVGEWVSITEDYNYGDTILFTKYGKIEKWKDFAYTDSTFHTPTYTVSDNKINITWGGITESFTYSIDNSNLTIYSFGFCFTDLAVVRPNVTFKKIK